MIQHEPNRVLHAGRRSLVIDFELVVETGPGRMPSVQTNLSLHSTKIRPGHQAQPDDIPKHARRASVPALTLSEIVSPKETDAPIRSNGVVGNRRSHNPRDGHGSIQRDVKREIVVCEGTFGNVWLESGDSEQGEAREELFKIRRGFREMVGLVTEVHSEQWKRDFGYEEEPRQRTIKR